MTSTPRSVALSRSALIVLALLALAGCGTLVRTQVTAFNEIEAGALAGRTVAVVPADPAKAPSLELDRYRQAIAARLAARGLVVVDAAEDAELLARIDAEIDGGRDREITRTMPVFGYGYGIGPFPVAPYRCVGRGADRNCYHPPPRYGVIGYETRYDTVREYTRTLSLRLVETTADGRPVYEGTAVSRGACGSLPAVFGIMADALFEDWPGADGLVRTVEVRAELEC
jgi:hypothetical protein